MPQETKAHPFSADDDATTPPPAREELQGWVPPLATDDEVRSAMDKAFDYRGDVTLTLRDGQIVEGYLFDRKSESAMLADCVVRILPKNGTAPVAVGYDRIARLEFTGRDTAEGKSFETWIKKYQEKKRAGEKNIGLEPEKLD